MGSDDEMEDGPSNAGAADHYSDDEEFIPPSQKQAIPLSSRAMPWVEKYRPKGIGDVASQSETVKTLQNAVKTGNLPHLLFYGPPGTGKTSMALALCRNLWGPDLFKQRVLEMNASDERGISIVRNKVKHFANLAISGRASSATAAGAAGGDPSQPVYPCPPFKLIILDEADTMTPDAQAALRRVIEAYSRITRFCLICNYVTRIIEPLASRCAKFRFKPLPYDDMAGKLRQIAVAEGVDLLDDVTRAIIELSEGDMRKAVTTMQCAFNLVGGGAKEVERGGGGRGNVGQRRRRRPPTTTTTTSPDRSFGRGDERLGPLPFPRLLDAVSAFPQF